MATAADQTAAFNAWQTAVRKWFDLWTNMIRTTDPNPLSGDQAAIDSFQSQIAAAKTDASAKESAYFVATGGTRNATALHFISQVNAAISKLEAIFQSAPSPTNPTFEASLSDAFGALTAAWNNLLSVAPAGVAPAGGAPTPIGPQAPRTLSPTLQAQLDAMTRNPGAFTQATITNFAAQLQTAGFPFQARSVRLLAPRASDAPPPPVGPATGVLPPQLAASFNAMIANPANFTQAQIAAMRDNLASFGYADKAAQLSALIPQGQPGPSNGGGAPMTAPPTTAPTTPAAPDGGAATPTAPSTGSDLLLAIALVGVPAAIGYALRSAR